MYFLRIGLLGSNFGDATIIAGANNDRMVAIKCPACKNVKLLSLEEYQIRKNNHELYCKNTSECRQYSKEGTLMQEICVYDFKCDTCHSVFTRSISGDGYHCISNNNTGSEIMCNTGDPNDRRFYCRKICAIAHCSYFKSPEMKNKCPALLRYSKNHRISDDELMSICALCENPSCKDECKINIDPECIEKCTYCKEAHECTPRPHILSFNDKWEAKCPKCASNHSSFKKGIIRPIIARTFAAYITASWEFEHDNGESFCTNLLEEANKVATIKHILDLDQMEEGKDDYE